MAQAGELNKLYFLVVRFPKGQFDTFIYAPAETDNIEVLKTYLSTKMTSGAKDPDCKPEEWDSQEPGAYPVDCYEIAGEVNRAAKEANFIKAALNC